MLDISRDELNFFKDCIALGKTFLPQETKRIGKAYRAWNAIVVCEADPSTSLEERILALLVAVRIRALNQGYFTNLFFMISVHQKLVASRRVSHSLIAVYYATAFTVPALYAHSCIYINSTYLHNLNNSLRSLNQFCYMKIA